MFKIKEYDLENWNGRGFYENIKAQYYQAAREAGIDYEDVYLNAEDSNEAYFEGLEWDNRLFLELIAHAQNKTILKSIVNWDERKNDIRYATRNFNPKLFLEHYNLSNNTSIYRNDFIDLNVEVINRIKTDMGIISEGILIKEFIKNVILYAAFIVRTYSDINGNVDNDNCKEQFFNSLYDLRDLTNIEQNFKREIASGYNINIGYGTTLLCDLLKESGNRFDYLIKPDTHIKSIFRELFGRSAKDSEIVDAFTAIIERIRNQGVTDITAYKLDKMLYILCGDDGFYSIRHNGVDYPNNRDFTMTKQQLLSDINNNFKINHR